MNDKTLLTEQKESEIEESLHTRRNELQPLLDRMEQDLGIWRLEAYNFGEKGEYDKFTSNEPRTQANKIISILSRSDTQIGIPLTGENEKQREKASQAERFCYGSLDKIDRQLMATDLADLKSLLAYHASVRGQYGLLGYVYKDRQTGQTRIKARPWDMLNTIWFLDDEGLAAVAYTSTRTGRQIKDEYGVGSGDRKVKHIVYDIWDRKNNAVLCSHKGGLMSMFGQREWLKEPKPHGLNYVPVHLSFTGAVPFVESAKYSDTIRDIGESIYSAVRGLVDPKNKLLTFTLTVIGQAAANPIAVYSQGGKKDMATSPMVGGSVVHFDVDKKEDAKPLFTPHMPPEAASMLGLIQHEESMAGLPPIAFGDLNVQLAGYGIGLLQDAAETALHPITIALEHGLEWLLSEMLSQFGTGFKPIDLRGYAGKDYFEGSFSSSDIRGNYHPEVKLVTRLPEDEPAKHSMAQIAVGSGLLSKQSAMDRYLGVQDTDLEMQKITREMAMMYPPVMLRRMAASELELGNKKMAQLLLAEIDRQEKTVKQPEALQGMPSNVMPEAEMEGEQPTLDERMDRLGLAKG